MDFIGIHGCSKVATIGKTVSSQHKFYRDQNEDPNTLISLYPEARSHLYELVITCNDSNDDGWGDGGADYPYLEIWEGDRQLTAGEQHTGNMPVWTKYDESTTSYTVKTDNGGSIKLKWNLDNAGADYGYLSEISFNLKSGSTTLHSTEEGQATYYSDDSFIYSGDSYDITPLKAGAVIEGSGSATAKGLIGLFDPNVTGSVGSGVNGIWSNLISGELADPVGGHKGNLAFENHSWTGYANQMEANIYGRSVRHFQFDGIDDYMSGPGGGPGPDDFGGYTSSVFFFDFNSPWSQCHWVYIPEKTGDAFYPISASLPTSVSNNYYELGVHVTGGNSCFYLDGAQVGIGSDAKMLGNKTLEPNHWHMVSLVFFPKLGEFDSHVNMYVNKQPDGLRFETTGQQPYQENYAINQSLMQFMYSADSSDINNCAVQIGKGKTLYTDPEFKHGHFIGYNLPITLSQIRTNYEALREFYVLDPTNE